jgi:two-component system response regulator HydG
MQYEWPGNVRQLRNTIEHAVVLCEGNRIRMEDLPVTVRTRMPAKPPSAVIRTIEETEREQIVSTLRLLGGNKAEAAKSLGISLSSLYQKLKKYNLRKDVLPQN